MLDKSEDFKSVAAAGVKNVEATSLCGRAMSPAWAMLSAAQHSFYIASRMAKGSASKQDARMAAASGYRLILSAATAMVRPDIPNAIGVLAGMPGDDAPFNANPIIDEAIRQECRTLALDVSLCEAIPEELREETADTLREATDLGMHVLKALVGICLTAIHVLESAVR